MSITGKLSKTNTGYEGFVADLAFDMDVRLVKNPRKTQESHPDFLIMGQSPKGRTIEVGAGWQKRSEAENDYISLGFKTLGRKVNCNAVTTPDCEDGELAILPFSDRAT